MPRPVYLVDHCAFRPKGADAEELRVNRKKIQEVWETSKVSAAAYVRMGRLTQGGGGLGR